MINFPAMTEAQRQQAIKDFTFRAVNTDCDVSLLAYQIALAALTAEPDHYVFHHPAGKLLNYLASDECKGQDHVVAGYTAPPAPVLRVPDGWKLVPLEPTEGMNKAGWRAMNEHDAINPTYRAMLAAAPEASNEQ